MINNPLTGAPPSDTPSIIDLIEPTDATLDSEAGRAASTADVESDTADTAHTGRIIGVDHEERLDKREEKDRIALMHFDQWLRNRHPELSEADIQKQIGQIVSSEAALELFVYQDDFDARMLENYPDWQRWFERGQENKQE